MSKEIKHTLKFERDDYSTILLDGTKIEAPLCNMEIITKQEDDAVFYSEVILIFDANFIYTDKDNRVFIKHNQTREIVDFEKVEMSVIYYENERDLIKIYILAKVEMNNKDNQ